MPADLVDDVADADFQTQNGSAHVCFRDFQTLIFNSPDHKLSERLREKERQTETRMTASVLKQGAFGPD